MHLNTIVCAIAALSMGFSASTSAQQEKDLRIDQAHRAEQRGQDQPGPQQRNPADRSQRAPERAAVAQRDAHQSNADRGHGWQSRRGDDERAANGRHFNRGDRLPTQYRDRRYVVDDWRGHRLSAPPRGYHWVQANGDFLLVAITTGVIASILLNQ